MSVTEPPLNTTKKPKKLVNIVLLTGHEYQTFVDVKAKFQDVFNQVAAHYGLREVEYFGLAEQKDGEYQFINPEEKVHKHAPKAWKSSSGEGLDKHGKPHLTVHFRVQYFVDQVILLREKITRQLYYLQLKENVLKYRYLFNEERCFQLAAYSLQTDLGNYSHNNHGSEPYFDPREYFPAWVVEKWGHDYLALNSPTMHQDLRNTTRSDAQLKFIREASLSPAAHNLHFYRLKKRKTDKTYNAWLGICPKGVEIYEDSPDGFKDLISTFFWPDIGKLYFEKKKFEIRSVGSWDGRKFTYYTDSDSKSKFLLSLCRSTHMFQMAIQPKLSEIRHLDAEDKRYRESYIYSDARDMPANKAASPARTLLSTKTTGSTGQRYSVVSNTSSNTTSGIVSDKLHMSFEESEEFEDDPMSEIMIDSPPRASLVDFSPRPAMGTAMLSTPKQGRGKLVPFSPKTSTGRTKEANHNHKSPVTRSGSNVSQGSKGSAHADLSPITSNGSYRSRLQQHQQMIQGARLQQMATQPQPFSNQSRGQTSPQYPTKGPPSPSSVSAKSLPFSLVPKQHQSTPAAGTLQTPLYSLPPKVPVSPTAAQSPALSKTVVHESPQRPIINQSALKPLVKIANPVTNAATKPPLPPQVQTPTQLEKPAEETNLVTQSLLKPLQGTALVTQPYTSQQVQVKPSQATATTQPYTSQQVQVNPSQATATTQPYTSQQVQVKPSQATATTTQPYTSQQVQVKPSQATATTTQPYTAQQVQVKPSQVIATTMQPYTAQQVQVKPSQVAATTQPYTTQQVQEKTLQVTTTTTQPYTAQQVQVKPPQATATTTQPYTAQQVHVKQPQQFLAQQVSPNQPKLSQQYYNQPEQMSQLHSIPTPVVSQYSVQQHATPLQQFAQEQPMSQQQFAIPLTHAQQKFAIPSKPQQVPQQMYVVQPQPHQQFLVPVPQQQFSVVHSKSQKHYAMPPSQPVPAQTYTPHQLTPPSQPRTAQTYTPHQLTPPSQPVPAQTYIPHQLTPPSQPGPAQTYTPHQLTPPSQPVPAQTYTPHQLTPPSQPGPAQTYTPHQLAPPQTSFPVTPAPVYNSPAPVYNSPPLQYPQGGPPEYLANPQQFNFQDKRTTRPASRAVSRGDSLKKTAGPLQLHEKSQSAPCNPGTSLEQTFPEAEQPSSSVSSNTPDDTISINSSLAMAEIDKAYSPLFNNYDDEYLVSESEDMDIKDILETSLGNSHLHSFHGVSEPSPSASFSYEDLEKALDKVVAASVESSEAIDKQNEEDAVKAKRSRIAGKNKKEKLHPELEEIRGNVKQFSLPLITALFNDITLMPPTSAHSSDLMYDTSTICSTDSRWSYDTDARRLSSSYPSSTGTMISLYSASRPFSWHSEHFDLDSQLAASLRLSNRRGPAALLDNTRSEPRYLNEVSPNPPVASWTQAISYGNPYGLSCNTPVDRYSPELLASQHMIPPKISSGGLNKPESNIKTLKENVGIA